MNKFDFSLLAETYQNNKPFPFVLIDNAFDELVLEKIVQEVSEITQWNDSVHDNSLKKHQNEFQYLGEKTKELLLYLNTDEFVKQISVMSGILNLLADNTYYGAGVSKISKGGFLNMHADFNWHKHLNLYRRINLLLYLNKDWKYEYNGNLELWDEKVMVHDIMPVFNRVVIFSTSNKSLHGHPKPLNPPEGRYRYTLSTYYYTEVDPSGGKDGKHSTLYL